MKNNYQKNITKLGLALVVITLFSCREKNGLAPEYMPDMYRSPSIETYVDYGEVKDKIHTEFSDKMSARTPVKGTIPRGFVPYSFENTPEGYIKAGETLKNPLASNENDVKAGEELYGMFCIQCHGKTGQGDGILVEREKFPPLPVKFNPGLDIPEGKMFHSVTYGKGLMGSHSSQLNQHERWLIISYIRTKFMNETKSAVPVDTVQTAQVSTQQ